MSIPKWTGELIGKMHNSGISKKELAARLEFTPEYVSMVLNGKKEPPKAEDRFNAAVDELIKEKAAKTS